MSRRLALEWQAFVVRSHSLRKVFVSVKGFFFQVRWATAAAVLRWRGQWAPRHPSGGGPRSAQRTAG